jgi:hypothetical protein
MRCPTGSARRSRVVPEARYDRVPEARYDRVPEARYDRVPEARCALILAPEAPVDVS